QVIGEVTDLSFFDHLLARRSGQRIFEIGPEVVAVPERARPRDLPLAGCRGKALCDEGVADVERARDVAHQGAKEIPPRYRSKALVDRPQLLFGASALRHFLLELLQHPRASQ